MGRSEWPGKKDAERYIQEVRAFHRRYRGVRGAFLMQDGNPSHTAADTAAYWSDCRDWWRPRLTPVHASWLVQAELLIGAFGHRYLKRASWRRWDQFLDHVNSSWPEYYRLYAHPFEWYWINQMMRQWFAKRAQG
jgi:hypothetical protein